MIQDWNRLLHFLAAEESVEGEYDLAILAGNSLPYLIDELFNLYQTKKVKQIMITGGIGHATTFLKKNLSKIGIESNLESEAELSQKYLIKKYGISKKDIILETKSTNSGENAIFSLNKMKEQQIQVEKVLLLQDPILQRRTKATFSKNWREAKVAFTNLVPILPVLRNVEKELLFYDIRLNDLWTKQYFISLVLGEIPRLRNNSEGYGPKGTQYIDEVIIPVEVEEAYARLVKVFHYQKER